MKSPRFKTIKAVLLTFILTAPTSFGYGYWRGLAAGQHNCMARHALEVGTRVFDKALDVGDQASDRFHEHILRRQEARRP